jgi:hypothetical protein
MAFVTHLVLLRWSTQQPRPLGGRNRTQSGNLKQIRNKERKEGTCFQSLIESKKASVIVPVPELKAGPVRLSAAMPRVFLLPDEGPSARWFARGTHEALGIEVYVVRV